MLLRLTVVMALWVPVGAHAPARAPVDVGALNKFAEEYNRYAAKIHDGVVDVKQWEKVERAWKDVR